MQISILNAELLRSLKLLNSIKLLKIHLAMIKSVTKDKLIIKKLKNCVNTKTNAFKLKALPQFNHTLHVVKSMYFSISYLYN